MLTSTHQKGLLMFLPLLVAFIALSLVIADLKHPRVSTDRCQLVGQGKSVQAFKQDAQVLYRRSGKDEDDIALSCQNLGKAVINDNVPLPLKPGQTVWLKIKDYQYLPKRYGVNVPVVNPNEAEVEDSQRQPDAS